MTIVTGSQVTVLYAINLKSTVHHIMPHPIIITDIKVPPHYSMCPRHLLVSHLPQRTSVQCPCPSQLPQCHTLLHQVYSECRQARSDPFAAPEEALCVSIATISYAWIADAVFSPHLPDVLVDAGLARQLIVYCFVCAWCSDRPYCTHFPAFFPCDWRDWSTVQLNRPSNIDRRLSRVYEGMRCCRTRCSMLDEGARSWSASVRCRRGWRRLCRHNSLLADTALL
jgi:hypothetical protein